MAISVVMPALEMAQETGKLLSWRKQEGETVTKGEPLLEIETDKVVLDIEAPADGVLAGVKQRDGAVVPVGEIIAWIVAPGEQPPADSGAVAASARATQDQARPKSGPTAPSAPMPPMDSGAKASPKARRMAEEHGVDLSRVRGTGPNGTITSDDILAAKQAASTPVPLAPPPPTPDGGARVSPKARRMAEEHGVDLTRVRGTGPNGTITGDDILAAAQQLAAAPAPQTTTAPPLSTIARLMAERTAQAWATVPHFFLTREIDAGALVQVRDEQTKRMEAAGGVRPTHTDLLIAIVARVLTKHPKMNASWTGSGIRLNPHVNISLAIAVKDGVIGAVIPNADKADLSAIATHRRDIADRAKAGRLHPPDIEGGTFTISNLGMYNVDAFQAIITPPQAAILAVGRIADRVVALNGAHAIRPRLTITLSSDHRVVDGAQAALFLNDLAEALEAPQKLLAR